MDTGHRIEMQERVIESLAIKLAQTTDGKLSAHTLIELAKEDALQAMSPQPVTGPQQGDL